METPKSQDCVISLISAREMSCDTTPRLPPSSGRSDEDKAPQDQRLVKKERDNAPGSIVDFTCALGSVDEL